MIDKLANLDRRWIFVFLAISVILPLIWPLGLPVEISDMTRKYYDIVEKLPEGSYVCMSFDYGPGTKIECHPMAIATLHHLFRKKCKVVSLSLWAEGSMFPREAFAEVAPIYGAKYGEDYLELGYSSGGEAILRGMGEDVRNIFPKDMYGRPLDSFPMMKKVKGWNSFSLVCSWSMGTPGVAEYVRVVAGQYNRPVVAGTTAVTTPEAYPFFNAHQIGSLLGGLRGACEYELLVGIKNGQATRGIESQSSTHFFIAFLIILANIIYFAKRKEE
ncbi:hypothetical protein IJT10_00545 [bacterium]|nr:hypothetical protein [bacterium]